MPQREPTCNACGWLQRGCCLLVCSASGIQRACKGGGGTRRGGVPPVRLGRGDRATGRMCATWHRRQPLAWTVRRSEICNQLGCQLQCRQALRRRQGFGGRRCRGRGRGRRGHRRRRLRGAPCGRGQQQDEQPHPVEAASVEGPVQGGVYARWGRPHHRITVAGLVDGGGGGVARRRGASAGACGCGPQAGMPVCDPHTCPACLRWRTRLRRDGPCVPS